MSVKDLIYQNVDMFYKMWFNILPVYVSVGYTMVGQVESIAYSDTISASYCFVAINDPSSRRNLYYHEVKREPMCIFSERCKELGITVKVIADTVPLASNNSNTIEHEHSNAKWW